MPAARLLSVNVGLPRDVAWRGMTVHTGVWEAPVRGRRMVRRLNVDDDGQGDLAGHGTGPVVSFARSGLHVRWAAKFQSILELAEACDVPCALVLPHGGLPHMRNCACRWVDRPSTGPHRRSCRWQCPGVLLPAPEGPHHRSLTMPEQKTPASDDGTRRRRKPLYLAPVQEQGWCRDASN